MGSAPNRQNGSNLALFSTSLTTSLAFSIGKRHLLTLFIINTPLSPRGCPKDSHADAYLPIDITSRLMKMTASHAI